MCRQMLQIIRVFENFGLKLLATILATALHPGDFLFCNVGDDGICFHLDASNYFPQSVFRFTQIQENGIGTDSN